MCQGPKGINNTISFQVNSKQQHNILISGLNIQSDVRQY